MEHFSGLAHPIILSSEAKKMGTANPFIRVENRNKNRPELQYARYCVPEWIDGHKTNNDLWLGRVINMSDGIFYSRERGYFKFSAEHMFVKLTDEEILKYQNDDKTLNVRKKTDLDAQQLSRPTMINFGSTYIINTFLNSFNIESFIDFDSLEERDSIFSLIFYRIIENKAYSLADDWWINDYASFLYPNARIQSQQICEILAKVGSEKFFRNFFTKYLDDYHSKVNTNNILIDSTCLQNDIKCHITALNNHNGVISKEIRLITVIDKISGMPLFFRYVPGNIVDVSTLYNIVHELLEYGISLNRLILDAGYYSVENLSELYSLNIPFMTRMVNKHEMYELLLKKYASKLFNVENVVKYGHRTLFMIKKPISIFKSEIDAFAYICLDINKKNEDYNTFIEQNDITKLTSDEFNIKCQRHGVFILLSNIDLHVNEVLPYYYARQSIEQLFDRLKNDIDILTLPVHSKKTIRGHIMICFIANIIFTLINKKLLRSKLCFSTALVHINRLKARIYKNKIMPDTCTKKINDVLKALKFKLVRKISINE
jgi:hypothetical protein